MNRNLLGRQRKYEIVEQFLSYLQSDQRNKDMINCANKNVSHVSS